MPCVFRRGLMYGNGLLKLLMGTVVNDNPIKSLVRLGVVLQPAANHALAPFFQVSSTNPLALSKKLVKGRCSSRKIACACMCVC